MGYSAYFFDFDYTLANSERGILLCYRHVLENNGFTGITDDTIKRTIGYTLTDSFAMMTGEKDVETLEAYRREYVKKADEVMVENTFLYPSAASVLKTLNGRGAALGIISTKYRYRLTATLEKYGVAELFDVIIGGEDVSCAKPDPTGLLNAIARIGAEKRDVLYVGDSIVDAETALNAGVDFAAVTTGTTLPAEFCKYPCRLVMDDLRELTGFQK